jgi:hypothetical protein
MSQANLDNQAIAQLDLAIYLVQQSEEASQYEIDCVPDLLGGLYRVWGGEKGITLLGTFYQNIDGFWISQPCNSDERLPWHSDTEAINAILAA